MKRKWHHPEAPSTGRQYWRSLGELEDSPEFTEWLQREFPQGAAELSNPDPDAEDGGVSRRNFIKLMGASTALAGFGMSGCRRPERYLVPYKEHVEWVVPGKPLLFASAKPRVGGRGCDPLVVTTYEGRPVKVDGNRMHPMVAGGSDALIQASVLDLYDPDRSRGYLKSGEVTTAADFEAGFLKAFRAGKGEKAALVIGETLSPTRSRLLDELKKKLPALKVFRYEALAPTGLRAAEKALYGEGVAQVPRLDKAQKILSLDCDFLGLDKIGEDSAAEFTRGRRVDDDGHEMNRLYVVEPAFTATGGMADHRLRLAASQIPAVAILLAEQVAKAAGDAALSAALKPLVAKVKSSVMNVAWIAEAAKDLAASKGKAVVVAGSRHSKEVHLLAAAMNAALGATAAGDVPVPAFKTGDTDFPGLAELAKATEQGSIDTVIFSTDADPYFDAPSDLHLQDLLSSDGVTVVHHGVRVNATAQAATWHVPSAHYLESWGDLTSATGVYSIVQPMILPLYDGLSDVDLVLALTNAPAGQAEEPVVGAEEAPSASMLAVRATFEKVAGKSGVEADKAWNATLRDGYLTGSGFERAAAPAAVAPVDVAKIELADLPYPEALEVVLATSSSLFDGRFANNGWMQEVPDPITKLTWDNAALMNFGTAEALGLKDEDLIEISIGEGADARTVTAPVLRSPGQADFTIQLDLGYYGADKNHDGELINEVGLVGSGVGFNAYPLMTTAAPYVATGAKVSKAGGEYKLALTAEHYSMEGRAIAREGTVDMLKADDNFAEYQGMDAHIPPDDTLYKGPDYANPTEQETDPKPGFPMHHPFRVDPNHQWAMTVDLHSCIGCNACTIACQAENNIPIVGKGEVMRGREMHWIRMDRYFSTPEFDAETVSEFDPKTDGEEPGRRKVDDDAVEMITQPVACQQCEAAPCETVCPVNATVHTGDGLNAMTYNRCIGTRYCANNCPYKARRFNYFDYNKRQIGYGNLRWGPLKSPTGHATTSEKLQKNPNVSVRMRGVIEKCTYCVQRINSAKIAAKVKAKDSPDIQVGTDAIKVACQQACPTEAIVFGNLKRADDKVNVMKANGRNYDLLRYIGARPRTSYLARIKNPNPAMPGADSVGKATSVMH